MSIAINVRINLSTYHDYFLCCMNAVLYLHQIRARGLRLLACGRLLV